MSSLYLSRLLLDCRSRRVMKEIQYPYEMHRTLSLAFPASSEEQRNSSGFLYRVEDDKQSPIVKVFVQSRIQPDWQKLQEISGYLYASESAIASKDIMPAYQHLQNGQMLAFKLRGNPTKRVGKQGDPHYGKRVELFREEEQIKWLMRKGITGIDGRGGGFAILEDDEGIHVNAYNEGKKTGRKHEGEQGVIMTHHSVLFDGILRITDAEKFRQTLLCGVGSGKAFGFGLLAITPIRNKNPY